MVREAVSHRSEQNLKISAGRERDLERWKSLHETRERLNPKIDTSEALKRRGSKEKLDMLVAQAESRQRISAGKTRSRSTIVGGNARFSTPNSAESMQSFKPGQSHPICGRQRRAPEGADLRIVPGHPLTTAQIRECQTARQGVDLFRRAGPRQRKNGAGVRQCKSLEPWQRNEHGEIQGLAEILQHQRFEVRQHAHSQKHGAGRR